MKHIHCIGACYLDTILNVPHYPTEDSKLRATSLTRRRGGNCSNTLEVLSQLLTSPNPCTDVAESAAQKPETDGEMTLTLITTLPSSTSAAAREILTSLGPRVGCERCIFREDTMEAASSYIIQSVAEKSRTIVNYTGLAEMTVGEFGEAVEPLLLRVEEGDGGWWHFEGRTPDVTLQCIRHLRSQSPGACISVEVEKPGREGLLELAEMADVVFYSKAWAQVSYAFCYANVQELAQGYHTAEELLRAQAPRMQQASLLCCTWADSGASALEPHTGRLESCPAYTPEGGAVVDTVGAGDTFVAGMLYGLNARATEWDLQRKLDFAVRLAGAKVAREGFGGLGVKAAAWVG